MKTVRVEKEINCVRPRLSDFAVSAVLVEVIVHLVPNVVNISRSPEFQGNLYVGFSRHVEVGVQVDFLVEAVESVVHASLPDVFKVHHLEVVHPAVFPISCHRAVRKERTRRRDLLAALSRKIPVHEMMCV